MLSAAQEQQIRENIKKLDYLNGTGVLSDSKKEMVKELFLIISSGGVGRKALTEVKKTIAQHVDENVVDKQIMYICVDTAYNELDNQKAEGALKDEEILKVPYENALLVINPHKMSQTTKEWVHPGLYDQTNAKSGYFDGTGASALRQCGRVMFAQSATQQKLYTRLSAIQAKAAAMAADGVSELKLQVIFLAGIAGGTGSGTIVDLGFLTRFYLKQILSGMQNRMTFSAYLFMPSASGQTTDALKQVNGNRNAYAALKEIDYFMNLKSTKDSFRMDYGTPQTHNMVIEDNLFDFCTLVEGVGSGGVFFGDPAGTARKITALSILNMICATSSKKSESEPGKEEFLVDSFLSNQDMQARTVLAAHSDRNWPREANYIYNVIGYAACVVPVDLLTVYAFKKVFDVIYAEFSQHRNATQGAAESFLKMCGLDFKTVEKNYKTMTPDTVRANLEQASGTVFKQMGPYYMINLTNQAVGLITNPSGGYLAQCQTKYNGFMADKNKWNYIGNLYTFLQNELTTINNSLYDIYTFVIEEMKRLLEENAGILTESTELKSKFGYSFYWSPIDLTKGANAENKAVALFLDGLMNPQRTMQLALQFVDRMYAQKERWTKLVPQNGQGNIPFDVADEIRGFIRTQMGDLVAKTLEDFIVITYSGDPGAVPSTMVNNVEVPSNATKKAAENILSRLKTQAVPLASVRGEFSLQECYNNVYLTIPHECKWLYEAIVGMAETYGLRKDNIFKSSSNDSITWSSLYSGVPAWAIAWTDTAEENYESGTGPNAIGLHIEQGTSGRKWADLPNLYPEGLWSPDERRIREREAGISKSVRKEMTEARDRGLLTPDRPLNGLVRFAQSETSQTLWDALKPMMTTNQKYQPKEMYQMLLSSGKASISPVEYIGFVATDDDEKDKMGLAFDMSCRVVRKNSSERKELKRSLKIGRELEAMLQSRNDSCVDMSTLLEFVDVLKWDIAGYEPYKAQWTLNLDVETQLGNSLPGNFEQQCAHYFAFRQYLTLGDSTREKVNDILKKKKESADTNDFKEQRERSEKLKKSINKLRTAKGKDEAPWEKESPFALSGNNSAWPMSKLTFEDAAAQRGYNAEDIRTFYQNLEENL